MTEQPNQQTDLKGQFHFLFPSENILFLSLYYYLIIIINI